MIHKEDGTVGTKRVHVLEILDNSDKENPTKISTSDMDLVPVDPKVGEW